MTIRSGETWIGIVEVAGPSSNPALEGGVGAYVAFLTPAADSEMYGLDARRAAGEQGLTVVQVLWAEPLSARVERVEVEEYLLALADHVAATGASAFGTFHAWEETE